MVRIEDGDPGRAGGLPPAARAVRVGALGLDGILRVPQPPRALVLFAHGSGSSRFSPRNARVAEALGRRRMATLLFDLLLPTEGDDRARVFDIPLLAGRLVDAVRWIDGEPGLRGLPLGLFGASTGAAAALVAARRLGPRIAAVVSRGGRPDLAGPALDGVTAPTLLIVGARDAGVIELNEAALARLGGEKALVLVPGATHLFEEPGTLDAAIGEAVRWFERHLPERWQGGMP
ncbi:dienelactone hydrolase family protein [Stella sp.]|uniref:dienelactone hydrolase family protein n=1 Tax=Stella sp. TaxID=2912054 RepID=UPI0035AFC408